MKDLFGRILIIIPLIFGACAPSSRHEPSAGSTPVEVETTYEPPRPTIVKEKGYSIARGATQIKDMTALFDSETKSMSLKGAIEYLPVKGGSYIKIDVNLVGMLDDDGFIVMKNAPGQAEIENITLAAKATCLSEEGTCSSSFIDIYLYTDGVVYHHQIESKEKKADKPAETPQQPPNDKKADTPPAQDDKVKDGNKGGPVKVDDSAKDDSKKDDSVDAGDSEEDGAESEFEGGADSADQGAGQYVGSVHDDIEKILKVKPAQEPAQDKEERDARGEKARLEREKAAQEQAAKEKAEKEKAEKEKADKAKAEKEKSDKKDDSKDGQVLPGTSVPTPLPRPDQKDDKVDDKKEDDKKSEDKKTPEVPVEKPKIQASSQAIGSVNAGRLENAVNMKNWEDTKGPVNFHIIRPERKRHFATNEMAYLINLIGNVSGKLIPGYKLAIGDISSEKGGRLSPHLSHTNGLDADIAFYFDNKSFQGYFASALEVNKPHHNWMVEEQWSLYKSIVRTQLIDRIFIHETLKKEICKVAIKNGEVTKETKSGPVYETLRRLIADHDHVTHFHMRAKCSSAQVRCRQMAEPAQGTGCF